MNFLNFLGKFIENESELEQKKIFGKCSAAKLA